MTPAPVPADNDALLARERAKACSGLPGSKKAQARLADATWRGLMWALGRPQ